MAPNNSDSDERGGFIDAGNSPVALVAASSGREDRHNREFPSSPPSEIRGSRKGKNCIGYEANVASLYR